MQNRTAPDEDGVVIDLPKDAGEKFNKALAHLITQGTQKRKVPQNFNLGLV